MSKKNWEKKLIIGHSQKAFEKNYSKKLPSLGLSTRMHLIGGGSSIISESLK